MMEVGGEPNLAEEGVAELPLDATAVSEACVEMVGDSCHCRTLMGPPNDIGERVKSEE
jgi:hypothetical protein